MAPTPPPTRTTIAETHYGSPDAYEIADSNGDVIISTTPELSVSLVKKTKKFYTADMQKKIATEYERSSDKQAVLRKYDISMSAVRRWIRDGITGSFPAERPARAEPADGRPLEELLWTVVTKARAAGDISKEDARRLLELVL